MGQKKKGIVQKTAERILMNVAKEEYAADQEVYLLDEQETRQVKMIYVQALFLSGVLGGLGVIVLFCTRYLLPGLFPRTYIEVPYTSFSFYYNIPFTLYGLVLAYVELYILYYVNLVAIKDLVVAFNYPHPSQPGFKQEVEMLAQVGIEKARKHGKEIGVNPYQGIPKIALGVYLVVNFYKAALSNIVIRVVVSRLGGRTLGRVFMDMLGVPVFAFWNILATRKILDEARIRIIGKPLTEKFVQKLYELYQEDEVFKSFIYDSIQYISMMKRTYNYTHFLFGDLLLKTFGIPVKQRHDLPDEYFEKLRLASTEVKKGIEKLIIFGMVIDGNINSSEKRLIKKAIENGVINTSVEEISLICREYVKGKGLPALVP